MKKIDLLQQRRNLISEHAKKNVANAFKMADVKNVIDNTRFIIDPMLWSSIACKLPLFAAKS